MENQENISNNQPEKRQDPNIGSDEQKEFGGGNKGTEINTGDLNQNKEVDLDRSGPNTGGEEKQNFGQQGQQQEEQQQEQQEEQRHVHPGEGTSKGYESNTPDIDEQTLKVGREEGQENRQSGTSESGTGSQQNANRGGQSGGQYGQNQDDTRRV